MVKVINPENGADISINFNGRLYDIKKGETVELQQYEADFLIHHYGFLKAGEDVEVTVKPVKENVLSATAPENNIELANKEMLAKEQEIAQKAKAKKEKK